MYLVSNASNSNPGDDTFEMSNSSENHHVLFFSFLLFAQTFMVLKILNPTAPPAGQIFTCQTLPLKSNQYLFECIITHHIYKNYISRSYNTVSSFIDL